MAALEVLALDEATPQIRAPGVGDTYAMPRALAITGELTASGLNVAAGQFVSWVGHGSIASLASGVFQFRDWGSTVSVLAVDAANTLALRNSTNAQTFNVYNTYTDASNYERLAFRYSGTTAIIETQRAGTGSYQTLELTSVSGATVRIGANVALSNAGSFALASAHLSMAEKTAPAGVANNAIVYAEDNGSGKTRLMVIFGSGAAQQIAIEP